MQFYIKEWSDCTVSLMTGTGQVLASFPSVMEAMATIKAWYQFNDIEPQDEVMIGVNSSAAMQESMATLHSFGF